MKIKEEIILDKISEHLNIITGMGTLAFFILGLYISRDISEVWYRISLSLIIGGSFRIFLIITLFFYGLQKEMNKIEKMIILIIGLTWLWFIFPKVETNVIIDRILASILSLIIPISLIIAVKIVPKKFINIWKKNKTIK